MATNPYVNKVEFGNTTVMDITDTTAEAGDVASGKVFYAKSGARSVGTGDYYSPSDTAETTIDDADYFPFYDSSATAKRKSLWSNIKSVLKSYFDNYYASSSAIPAFNPQPASGVNEAAVVSAINTAISVDGGSNDEVGSLFGIGKWSNTKTKTYVVQGIAGSNTPISTTGIGTWDDTGVDQTGWITISDLIGCGSNTGLDIKLSFDPALSSVPITLGGYVIDDSTGKMCIKFGNEIPEADTHTAKIGIELVLKRTDNEIAVS